MTEFLPFNARPLRTLKNYSGTRVDKTAWIGTGWCKLFRKYYFHDKYPVKPIKNLKLFLSALKAPRVL